MQCPPGTTWKVGLDRGSSSRGQQRYMTGPFAETIAYDLYRDPARTLPWGDARGQSPSDDTVRGTGTGAIQSLTVYGRVPSQADAPVGHYSDTVVVTLVF